MSFEVKIIADSLAPCGKRLTTVTMKYPRFIHSEIMTHRDRARNAASSRAIPWPKMMEAIANEPVVPLVFGSEQRGMQTGGEIDNPDLAETIWLDARDSAIKAAKKLSELGVHKSICNRLTEPWMWITVVMSATEWNNFFRLRCHPDAEIHFQKIAGMVRDAIAGSKPKAMHAGQWHLPFIDQQLDSFFSTLDLCEETELDSGEILRRCSVARCARVSYLNHDGTRDMRKDLELFDRLVQGSGFGHWSAHEHIAEACSSEVRSGPFIGWRQYRKSFANENLPG